MSLVEVLTFVFFMANLGIFIAKIINVSTHKFEPGERSLKYYGKEWSLVLMAISLIAWLMVLTSFIGLAGEIEFWTSRGIPVTEYLQYGIILSMSNIFLILNGIFTFFELILLMWADIRVKQPQARGYGNRYVKPKP